MSDCPKLFFSVIRDRSQYVSIDNYQSYIRHSAQSMDFSTYFPNGPGQKSVTPWMWVIIYYGQ